jgi:hypothetical protein
MNIEELTKGNDNEEYSLKTFLIFLGIVGVIKSLIEAVAVGKIINHLTNLLINYTFGFGSSSLNVISFGKVFTAALVFNLVFFLLSIAFLYFVTRKQVQKSIYAFIHVIAFTLIAEAAGMVISFIWPLAFLFFAVLSVDLYFVLMFELYNSLKPDLPYRYWAQAVLNTTSLVISLIVFLKVIIR